MSSYQLPIIDLRELDNPATQKHFYQKLRFIAREIGFFYLVGHAIPVEQREDLLVNMKRFFALPKTEKDKINMSHSRHFRGYTASTQENTRNQPDYREQIDIGEELPALALTEQDPIWWNLQGPNQWPEALPELKTAALAWQSAMRDIAVKLIRAFLVALELPENSFDQIIAEPAQHLLKLIHYPARDDQNEGGQGVGAHKDAGILTLLWQDNIGGLQVETDNGWVDVAPLENAFVVNIGEVFELATNGYLRANVHQVVRQKNSVSRYSIAYFITPSVFADEVPLLPLPHYLAQQALGPESDPLNPMFTNLGKNAIKGRLRSHLSVTRQFYPEEYEQIVKNSNIL
ncbi:MULTISPECIES: isopenicillin N synthase family dioxygenase [Providencia]|uniref:Isopenicillin N synthase family oxygenase n=1 Tax=Providencia stuartii TaxID=588 RepID=A0ABD5L5I7_PROST|nr:MULTISPECIES: 2-oxoglutarate and iron-dependent oxygenase domain-containing protein [Providencia]ELR5044513.1 isopenicillin N synthase family oxygenase [Providencia rettgeri]ELR5292532.1 isopenicillin N synthase family oxygenase [Providencia stuartii]MCR4181211.1 isopenicillin N synthase family oxygenase [Providencia vermicola]URE79453.1 isopenicillin N synthase family oxygenase [Providencia stuartii]